MAQYLISKGVSFIRVTNPPVNSLSLAVRDGILKGIEQARVDKCRALVLFGDGKNFSAGADIKEFTRKKHLSCPSLNEVIEYLDEYESPVVACINGVALGGGLETALACHWRIASKGSQLGLPEVHLGILPGAGGTQRLPRIIGVKNALEMMTTGRLISADEGLKLGLLDSVAPSFTSHDDLMEFATTFVDSIQDVDIATRRVSSKLLSEDNLAVMEEAEKRVASAARGFVAPLAIAKATRAAIELPFRQGMVREAQLFAELAKGTQAPALQYQFFSERAVSSPPTVVDASKVPTVTSVGVIGGGTMGAGISMCFANAGIPVTLVETSQDLADASIKRIEGTYKASSAFKSGKLTEDAVGKLTGLITPSGDMQTLATADLVIEAVFENMDVKKDIFGKLEKICKPDAILATNTSYLSIDEIANITNRQRNVIGTHFFSPANVMKLLEVVKGKDTSTETIAACMKLGKKISKIPVLSGNCFGFIGNRMLSPYSKEANFLVEEGATPAQVDNVLKTRVGLAMGLFEMGDLAGNDVGWRLRQGMGLVGGNATGRVSGERYSSLADELCAKGWFGQKTRKGWYAYDPAAPRAAIESADTMQLIEEHRAKMGMRARVISDDEIIERCLYSLVNEGFRILEEGIAAGPADIDVVYVNGYGFPKYRGGPMWWAEREIGLSKIYTALKKHSEERPDQPWLKPAQLMVDVIESGANIKEELFFRQQNRKK